MQLKPMHVLLLLVGAITVLTSATALRTDQESQDDVGAIRDALCRVEPALCDAEATTTLLRTHNGLLSTFAHALAESSMSSAVEAFAAAQGLDAGQVAALAVLMQSDPHRAVAKMRSALQQESQQQQPPYFGFVPQLLGHLIPGVPFNVSTPCFASVVLAATYDPEAHTLKVDLFPQGPRTASLCLDRLYFSVGARTAKLDVWETDVMARVVINLTSKVAEEPALMFDMRHNGVRVYRFDRDELTRRLDVVDTVLLFLPMLTGKLDIESARHNVDFLSNFTLMFPAPAPRNYTQILPIDPSYIRSGDLFGKLELDGLGPVEALGQGTTSGHVAFALWSQDGNELFVCESITIGVTCTEWGNWTVQMQASNSSIVHVPLAPHLSDSFNATAAWAWVTANLGNEYGFFNFFFGWIDTVSKNLPCFPSSVPATADGVTWERCLTWEHIELVMFTLDELVPALFDKFFGQALNHRLGTVGLNCSQIVYGAFQKLGLSGAQLATIPERDGWLYNATRRGFPGETFMQPSQVCSTLACNALRAGGVFDVIDGQLSCGEMTVWDMFSLKIFDDTKMRNGRPQVCIDADPENPLCQITGSYTFTLLRDVNSRVLFTNMSNSCASRNPVPYDRTGCYSEV